MVDAKYEEGQAKLLPIGSPACEYKFYLQMAKVLFQFPPIINYFITYSKLLWGRKNLLLDTLILMFCPWSGNIRKKYTGTS